MIVRLTVRGFLKKIPQFEERLLISDSNLDDLLPDLGNKHGEAMNAGTLDMVEIEFLDEPDPNQRFFRIGTNPAGMVIPIGLKL